MSDHQLPVVRVEQLTKAKESTGGTFRFTRSGVAFVDLIVPDQLDKSDVLSVELSPSYQYVASVPLDPIDEPVVVIADPAAAACDRPPVN